MMIMTAMLAATMMTPWGEKVTAENVWREYPRPQMVRENWTNLNGMWDYTIVSNASPAEAVETGRGKILVPFAFEAPLSGVQRLVQASEKMIYTRKITVSPRKGYRTLINFEAVDWRAQVFVNGVEADVPHEGGNLPFSIDVTDLVKEGENELKVIVWDPTDTFIAAGGKQNNVTYGCFYTRVSGIWQTVWMEEVPEHYIRSYKVFTDIDKGTVRFEFDKVDGAGEVEVTTDLPKNFECWTPENPKLYKFTAKYGEDVVKGYFGMRKIGKAMDAKGEWRYTLNGKFIFPMGTLDQGWWPDGLLTPPSFAACENDIITLKKCGFNMMRKHIKVEPRLYYYLCDKLGILVFQDAPSPAGQRVIRDATKNLQRYGMYRREWKEQIDHLFNYPSIVEWIPYNEAWGQPDVQYTLDTQRWTKRYDPSRLVSGPSGWSDYEGGRITSTDWKGVRDSEKPESEDPSCDAVDCHAYPGPRQCVQHKNRISVLGEFGGLGLRIDGHLWDSAKSWGYAGTGKVASREDNQKHYLELQENLLPLIENGLAATVYTQTTDVEVEINGLMTYDRKVLKYDPEVLKAEHAKIMAAAAKAAKGE